MKYLKNGSIDLDLLKHDVLGLHGPLSYCRELIENGDKSRTLKIQTELLKKIEFIVKEIENIQPNRTSGEINESN